MDLNKLYDKQDKILEEISNIKVILGKQHVSIDHHIKRTDILEESLDLVRKDLKPIQTHVEAVGVILKILGSLSAFVSFALGVFKAYEIIFK